MPGATQTLINAEGGFVKSFPGESSPEPRRTFVCLSIFGPQSSGKSTLLNDLFGTGFSTMDATRGRSQTTKGIMGTFVQSDTLIGPLLILDCEGSDSRERNLCDSQNIEWQIGCFAAAVSNIFLINLWAHDVGRHNAANYNTLSVVFDTYFKSLYQVMKHTSERILFVLTVRDAEEEGREEMDRVLQEDIRRIYRDAAPQEHCERFDQFFRVSCWFLPHRKYLRSEYDGRISSMREELYTLANKMLNDADVSGSFSSNAPLLVGDLSVYYGGIWDVILANKALDIPSQRELLSAVRCEEFYNAAVDRFSQKFQQLSRKVRAVLEKVEGSIGIRKSMGNHTNSVSSLVLPDSTSLNDFAFLELHRTCSPPKVVKIIVTEANEAITYYVTNTQGYSPKNGKLWLEKLHKRLHDDMSGVTKPLAQAVREATITGLRALVTPFVEELELWLERRQYEGSITGGLEVDIITPDLISDRTFSCSRACDLHCLVLKCLETLKTCLHVEWGLEFDAVVRSGLFVNHGEYVFSPPMGGLSNFGLGNDDQSASNDGFEVLTGPSSMGNDLPGTDLYALPVRMFLKNALDSPWVRYIKEHTEAELTNLTQNVYDALNLISTTMALWFGVHILPLSLLHRADDHIRVVVMELNTQTTQTLLRIRTVFLDVVAAQSRNLAVSSAHFTLRKLHKQVYAELSSLRGALVKSGRKCLVEALQRTVHLKFVDDSCLTPLRRRLSASIYTSQTPNIAPSVVYTAYIGLGSLTSPTLRFNMGGLSYYDLTPLSSCIEIGQYNLPNDVEDMFVTRIDEEVIKGITQGMKEFIAKSLPTVLQDRFRHHFGYDEGGREHIFGPKDDLGARFDQTKARIEEAARKLTQGTLEGEGLNPKSIHPASADDINIQLQIALEGWNTTLENARVAQQQLIRDGGWDRKHLLIAILLLLAILRVDIFKVFHSRLFLFFLSSVGIGVFLIRQKLAPEELQASLGAISQSISVLDVRGFARAIKDLTYRALD